MEELIGESFFNVTMLYKKNRYRQKIYCIISKHQAVSIIFSVFPLFPNRDQHSQSVNFNKTIILWVRCWISLPFSMKAIPWLCSLRALVFLETIKYGSQIPLLNVAKISYIPKSLQLSYPKFHHQIRVKITSSQSESQYLLSSAKSTSFQLFLPNWSKSLSRYWRSRKIKSTLQEFICIDN